MPPVQDYENSFSGIPAHLFTLLALAAAYANGLLWLRRSTHFCLHSVSSRVYSTTHIHKDRSKILMKLDRRNTYSGTAYRSCPFIPVLIASTIRKYWNRVFTVYLCSFRYHGTDILFTVFNKEYSCMSFCITIGMVCLHTKNGSTIFYKYLEHFFWNETWIKMMNEFLCSLTSVCGYKSTFSHANVLIC